MTRHLYTRRTIFAGCSTVEGTNFNKSTLILPTALVYSIYIDITYKQYTCILVWFIYIYTHKYTVHISLYNCKYKNAYQDLPSLCCTFIPPANSRGFLWRHGSGRRCDWLLMDSEQVGEGSWAGNNFRFNLRTWKSPLIYPPWNSWKHLKINGWKI